MTLKEALKWAEVMLTADHGCPSCIRNITEEANAAFPEFEFAYDEEAEPYPGTITVRARE